MRKTHQLNRNWRYLLIVSGCVGLFFFVLLSFFVASTTLLDTVLTGGLFLLIGGAAIYTAVSSRIVTSPEGLEYSSLGLRTKVPWSSIQGIHMNESGQVNLLTTERLYWLPVLNALMHALGIDQVIQLSPFIDDISTSGLLADIAKYAPTTNVSEFLALHAKDSKPVHGAGALFLYYFCAFIFGNIPVLAVIGIAKHFQDLGWQDFNIVGTVVYAGFSFGIFVNAFSLVQYHIETRNLPPYKTARKARAHYLSPLVVFVTTLLAGLAFWLSSRGGWIAAAEADASIIGLLVALPSLWLSSRLERVIFPRNR